MTNPEAYLQCRCGACVIALVDPQVRARTQCFCFDCRQRGLISAAQSPENALPDEVRSYERGVDLAYFSNSLIVDDSSRQLLEYSKLTREGSNTTAMSSCCGTLMCGIHPLYEGNTISVNTDSCRINVPSDIPVDAVVFACDAPAKQAALIAEQSSIPVIFNVFESLDSSVMREFIAAVTAPIPGIEKIEGAVTFEDLCAAKTLTICSDFHIESRGGKTIKPDQKGKS